MANPLHILIAEDNPSDAKLIVRALRQAGFEFEHQQVDSEADYLSQLHSGLDIILSDYEMPQFGGMRALELLNESGLEIPFIIISGTIGEDLAVAAMKHGATDYLLKDRLARLGPAVERALEQGRLRRERKQSETALRESEERFRQLAENIHEVFWLTEIEKDQILYVSPAYEVIWGQSRATLYASPHTWLDAIHPDDREHVYRSSMTNLSSGIYDEQYRIVRPDGTVRWIRDRAFPVVNADGEVDRVAGVARDITEQKQADEALRLFRNLVDQSTDSFIVVDPQTGRFIDVNEKGCSEFGYPRAEFLSQRVCDIDPSISEEDWPTVSRKVRSAGFVTSEGLLRRKNGSTFLMELHAKWVHLDRDYIVAVVRDVSDRKQVEERVREQAAMLDLAHDAILVRGFHDRKIRFWNKGAESLYGWTAAEAAGQDVGDLICVEPNAPDEIREELNAHGEWRGETHHKTKDGRKLIVSTRITLVRNSSGEPDAVLSINTDMTEQKELESRYLRAQRMESIGTLASGVAHDLNNILAPIMMSVPVLRRDLTAEQREGVITTIEMSATRGAEIVRQVLTFGRGLEGERLLLHVDVLIKEVMKIMRGTFPKGISTRSSLAAELWPVLGDATQLHQVLLNLCVNARDAMPDGGRVLVTAKNLEVDESYASMLPEAKPGPHVLLEISDTGSGIPPEIVERIFDPFFTTKAIGKGSGLGLSTTLGIVKSHGGFIQVQSQPDKGTTFQIYLPAAPDHDPLTEDVSPEPIPLGHGETVLVVDDEPSVSSAARLALETAGYKVLLAADGTEALAVFAMNSGDVAAVLTDLMMPFMDGVALTRALRVLRPNLPIIASTGLGEKAQLAELKAMNVETVLHKPYGADTLLRTIHAALNPEASIPTV